MNNGIRELVRVLESLAKGLQVLASAIASTSVSVVTCPHCHAQMLDDVNADADDSKYCPKCTKIHSVRAWRGQHVEKRETKHAAT